MLDGQQRMLAAAEAAQAEQGRMLVASEAAQATIRAEVSELMLRAAALEQALRAMREAHDAVDAHHVALIAALLDEQKRIGAELEELKRPVDPPGPGRPG